MWVRVTALLVALLAVALRVEGTQPQSLGLPDEVAADVVGAGGYVSYDGVPDLMGPASNGPPHFTPDDVTRDDVFEEDHAARLPAGAQILRHWDGAGREIWEYPVGTRVVHRFFLKTVPMQTLFEMRVVEKRADGRWAFGAYDSDGATLRVRRVMLHDVFDVELPRGRVRVEMDRLHPESCRLCHAMHSPQAYQYEDEEHAGPCEFGPANPSVLTTWASLYAARYGYWPFAN